MSVDLVGRDTDRDALLALLDADRLVEIIGPGGVGKTALAIAVARTWSDGGAWIARLEAATTAEEVHDVLMSAFNVTGGDAALVERVRTVTGVLVLDNCEHVIDAAATVAVRLLDAAPGLRILCTSQVPLDVDGEVRHELAPLALEDAVDLFARRAAAQRVSRTPNDPDAVQELCRSLDGLPLAIELAAARTKTLPIDEITRRLDDRFAVLHDPASRKPGAGARCGRPSTGATSCSSRTTSGASGRSPRSGGAPLPAVEFVLEALDVPATAALDVVGRLASRSLVIIDDDNTALTFRYRLLDSIRVFAVEAATDAGCAGTAMAAHARWFAGVAAASTAGVRSRNQSEQLAWACNERANIDVALAWSATNDPLLGLAIANGFGWAWVVLGDSRGGQRILAALDAVGDAAPAPRPCRGTPAGGLDRGLDGEPRTGERARRRGDRDRRGAG